LAQHVQDVEQVVAVDPTSTLNSPTSSPVGDEGAIRGDRVALHQVEPAPDIVGQFDAAIDRAIEGRAVDPIPLARLTLRTSGTVAT
jgi:hypothetical protein